VSRYGLCCTCSLNFISCSFFVVVIATLLTRDHWPKQFGLAFLINKDCRVFQTRPEKLVQRGNFEGFPSENRPAGAPHAPRCAPAGQFLCWALSWC